MYTLYKAYLVYSIPIQNMLTKRKFALKTKVLINQYKKEINVIFKLLVKYKSIIQGRKRD